MKYLCLIYHDERLWQSLVRENQDAIYREYSAFTDGIKQAGQYLASHRLRPAGTAVTVRVRQGEILTTDGPFAETKEQLGGYFLIEAGSLSEAVRIAAQIPGARHGSVEVRTVFECGPTDSSASVEE